MPIVEDLIYTFIHAFIHFIGYGLSVRQMDYGSHTIVETQEGTSIIYGDDSLMWMEVVQGRNVENDVHKKWHINMVHKTMAMRDFGIDKQI